MGLSGLILDKNQNRNLLKLKKEILDIFFSLSCDCYDFNENLRGEEFCSVGVNKFFPNGQEVRFVMYIFGRCGEKECETFEWTDKKLYTGVLIEDIADCEKLVLDFLVKFFENHPDVIFYDELDWYYTKEDIEKIYSLNNIPEDWCYKRPEGILKNNVYLDHMNKER